MEHSSLIENSDMYKTIRIDGYRNPPSSADGASGLEGWSTLFRRGSLEENPLGIDIFKSKRTGLHFVSATHGDKLVLNHIIYPDSKIDELDHNIIRYWAKQYQTPLTEILEKRIKEEEINKHNEAAEIMCFMIRFIDENTKNKFVKEFNICHSIIEHSQQRLKQNKT